MQAAVEGILTSLEARGYAQKCQVVWGQPNLDVPYGWETAADTGARAAPGDGPPLAAFQVLFLPSCNFTVTALVSYSLLDKWVPPHVCDSVCCRCDYGYQRTSRAV